MVKRPNIRRRNRRAFDAAVGSTLPAVNVLSVTAGASRVTIVFDGVIGLTPPIYPATWVFGTANLTVTSVISATPTSMVLGLTGTPLAAQAYSVGSYDPAVRTPTGGYVAGKVGVLV